MASIPRPQDLARLSVAERLERMDEHCSSLRSEEQRPGLGAEFVDDLARLRQVLHADSAIFRGWARLVHRQTDHYLDDALVAVNALERTPPPYPSLYRARSWRRRLRAGLGIMRTAAGT
jgi:hypothetical protein